MTRAVSRGIVPTTLVALMIALVARPAAAQAWLL